MIYEPRLLADEDPQLLWSKISLGEIETTLFEEILQWCKSYDSDGTYSVGRWAFYFSRPEDALIFSLKWNGMV